MQTLPLLWLLPGHVLHSWGSWVLDKETSGKCCMQQNEIISLMPQVISLVLKDWFPSSVRVGFFHKILVSFPVRWKVKYSECHEWVDSVTVFYISNQRLLRVTKNHQNWISCHKRTSVLASSNNTPFPLLGNFFFNCNDFELTIKVSFTGDPLLSFHLPIGSHEIFS